MLRMISQYWLENGNELHGGWKVEATYIVGRDDVAVLVSLCLRLIPVS